MEVEDKVYSKKGQSMCVNDGYVLFRNSQLMSGRVGKVCALLARQTLCTTNFRRQGETCIDFRPDSMGTRMFQLIK